MKEIGIRELADALVLIKVGTIIPNDYNELLFMHVLKVFYDNPKNMHVQIRWIEGGRIIMNSFHTPEHHICLEIDVDPIEFEDYVTEKFSRKFDIKKLNTKDSKSGYCISIK